jgi:hypothetical protein
VEAVVTATAVATAVSDGMSRQDIYATKSWLEYAITAIDFEDADTAKMYLRKAYFCFRAERRLGYVDTATLLLSTYMEHLQEICYTTEDQSQ